MKYKKLIAPVAVTVLLAAAFVAHIFFCVLSPLPLAAKIIGAAVGLGLIGVSVFVLVERIIEIKKGEEDDLGKY